MLLVSEAPRLRTTLIKEQERYVFLSVLSPRHAITAGTRCAFAPNQVPEPPEENQIANIYKELKMISAWLGLCRHHRSDSIVAAAAASRKSWSKPECCYKCQPVSQRRPRRFSRHSQPEDLHSVESKPHLLGLLWRSLQTIIVLMHHLALCDYSLLEDQPFRF